MTKVDAHPNEQALKRLNRQERYNLFGLTVPYLGLISLLIIIPIGWLFYMSIIGRDGSLSLKIILVCLSKAYTHIYYNF